MLWFVPFYIVFMSELTCEVYGKSVARNRCPDEENFDAVHVDKDSGEIIVCDGMGKRPGSKLAALKVIDYLKSPEARAFRVATDIDRLKTELRKMFRLAAIEVEKMAILGDIDEIVGTTCVMAKYWLADTGHRHRVSSAHIGDSRLYRKRENKLDCLTLDGNAVTDELLTQAGTNKRAWEWQNELDRLRFDPDAPEAMRAFLIRCGITDEAELKQLLIRGGGLTHVICNSLMDRPSAIISNLKVEPGDEFFGVSDGVSSNIHPDRLEWISIQDRPLSERVDLMIDEAQENGRKVPDDDLWRGSDDTTAAALRPIL